VYLQTGIDRGKQEEEDDERKERDSEREMSKEKTQFEN
jgi:hypothetical protein